LEEACTKETAEIRQASFGLAGSEERRSGGKKGNLPLSREGGASTGLTKKRKTARASPRRSLRELGPGGERNLEVKAGEKAIPE